jgi:hypothetical protein
LVHPCGPRPQRSNKPLPYRRRRRQWDCRGRRHLRSWVGGDIIMFLHVAPLLFRGSLVGLLLASLWCEVCATAENGVDGELGARTFYVDSETGRDSNDGQSRPPAEPDQ